jgi:hypothetical protein
MVHLREMPTYLRSAVKYTSPLPYGGLPVLSLRARPLISINPHANHKHEREFPLFCPHRGTFFSQSDWFP